MLKHVVMWTVKEDGKQANINKMVDLLNGLKDKVEVVRDLQAGTDILHSDASYDVALIVTLDSKEDLAVYRDHPEHVKVARFIGEVRDKRAVVDFEI